MAFFTPKWTSQKADIRLKAIAELSPTSPELIQLAQIDPDQQVRSKAITHLQHIPTLAELATVALSPFSNVAKSTLSQLIGQEGGDDKALAAVLHLIPQDQTLYLNILNNPNRDLGLRKQILAKINNQTTLHTIAQSNPSKELQTLAASQISDVSTLKQLLANADNNKSLRQLLKTAIIEHEQHEKNETGWLQLCGAIESLGTADKWQQEKRTYQLLQQDSATLTTPSEAVQTRFKQACQQYESQFAEYETAAQEFDPQRQAQQTILARITELTTQLTNTPESLTPSALKHALKTIKSEWQAIDSLPQAEQAQNQIQYQEAIDTLDKRAKELTPELDKLHQLINLNQQANKLNTSQKPIRPQQIINLEKQWQQAEHPQRIGDLATLKQDFNQAIAQLNKRAKQQKENAGEQLSKINALLDQLDEQLKADQSNKAVNSYHQLAKLFDQADNISPTKLSVPQQRFNKASATVRQLQGWKHWGTDQAREQLIGRAKVLATDDSIAPTALAKDIGQLRDAWKNMGRANSKSYDALWAEFDNFCTLAYARCEAFFQQQADKRNSNLSQRETLCEQLENLLSATDWATADWSQVTNTIKTARRDWRKMGGVDRKQWEPINKRFNSALDALEAPLSVERAANLEQRQRLIHQMEQLTDKKDIRIAIDKARFLQNQWQVTVAGSRNEEQTLWETFRTAAAAVFDRQRSEQRAQKEAVSTNLTAQKQLCKTIEDMCKLDDAALLKSSADLDSLHAEFMALEPQPVESKERGRRKPSISPLMRRFNQARDKVEAELVNRKASAKQNDFQVLQQKSTLCEQLEQSLINKQTNAPDLNEWDELPALKDKKLDARIVSRYQAALAGNIIDKAQLAENTERKHDLCLQLEILLDQDTPTAFKQQRMAEQLAYLSGEKQAATNPITLAQQFLSMTTTTSKEKSTIDTRFNALLAAISKV